MEGSRPAAIAACFDESLGTCYRNELYAHYKVSRALPDEALAFQLQACRDMTELLGVASYASVTYEADDLIGTLAAKARSRGKRVCIVSRDKDLLQLLKPGDRFWDCPDGSLLDEHAVLDQWGVKPAQIADYLALVGDAGDDIPGVPGVGPKTAAALLGAFDSIPELLAQVEAVASLPIRGAAKLGDKLRASTQQLLLMRQLTHIHQQAPLGRRLRWTWQPQLAAAQDFADALGFGKPFFKALQAFESRGV